MDRLAFAKGITYTEFENEIKLYFDQIMTMYDIVGSYANIQISTNTDSDISFDILIDREDDVVSLLFDLSVIREIHKYDKVYQLRYDKKDKNIIHINLIKIQ